MKLYIINTT